MTALDTTPRFTPETTITVTGRTFARSAVVSTVFYPPGTHPPGCPLRPELGALELRTERDGSAWWGFERGWIGSDLRFRVAGFPAACELRSAWPVADEGGDRFEVPA